MARTGTNIQSAVSEVLSDPSAVDWTTAQILSWINEAQYAISVIRPDASAQIVNLQLSGGTKQTITGRRLLDVIRNMGTDGGTPGKAITKADWTYKDRFNPNWHTDAASNTIDEYMHDPRIPDVFYVYPPANSGTYVELKQAIVPTDLTQLSDNITIDEIYAPAIIEWVLYRCFSRDSVETPNNQRAMQHYTAFFDLLGRKTQIDTVFTPREDVK